MKKSFGNSLGKKPITNTKKISKEPARIIGQEPYQLKGQFVEVLSQKNGKNTEYYFFKNKGDFDPAVIEIYPKPKNIPYPSTQIITEAYGLKTSVDGGVIECNQERLFSHYGDLMLKTTFDPDGEMVMAQSYNRHDREVTDFLINFPDNTVYDPRVILVDEYALR